MHVLDEDIELYLLGRLSSHRLTSVESHLAGCTSCVARLSGMAGIVFRLIRLSRRQLGSYTGAEKRRYHRIPTDDPGHIQMFSPFSPDRIPIRVIDVSRSGLKVRVPQYIPAGTVAQVRVKQAIILGEVRYCVASGEEFDAGIQIQDVVPRYNS
jgi:hypothetical protein